MTSGILHEMISALMFINPLFVYFFYPIIFLLHISQKPLQLRILDKVICTVLKCVSLLLHISLFVCLFPFSGQINFLSQISQKPVDRV